jgi:hypothetical protein
LRTARRPSPKTKVTAKVGCTTATAATANAATCDPVPSIVAAWPTIHLFRFSRRRRLRPLAVMLSSAASCCSTAPTANSTAASVARVRPRTGFPVGASASACMRCSCPSDHAADSVTGPDQSAPVREDGRECHVDRIPLPWPSVSGPHDATSGCAEVRFSPSDVSTRARFHRSR